MQYANEYDLLIYLTLSLLQGTALASGFIHNLPVTELHVSSDEQQLLFTRENPT